MESKLIWKPLSVEHINLIHDSIRGNIAEYFYDFQTIDETEAWVKEAVSKHESGNKKEYVIFDGGDFIGMVSPQFISDTEVDVGIWIETNHQGKGYGKRVLEELFTRMKKVGVERIIYNTDVDNLASIKLATSTGFNRVEAEEGVRFVKNLK